jgi:hypothetical protein
VLKNLCTDDGFAGQSAVHQAPGGNISKLVDLFGCKISFEVDLAFENPHPGVWIAFTIFTVFSQKYVSV